MRGHHSKPVEDDAGVVDLHYWHKAVLQTRNGRKTVKVDAYRWALHYEQLARKRHGFAVNLKDVLADLEAGWDRFGGGPGSLTLKEAKEAVTNSWHRSDELRADSIAKHNGFKSPPTFTEKGTLVPRNLDEANS